MSKKLLFNSSGVLVFKYRIFNYPNNSNERAYSVLTEAGASRLKTSVDGECKTFLHYALKDRELTDVGHNSNLEYYNPEVSIIIDYVKVTNKVTNMDGWFGSEYLTSPSPTYYRLIEIKGVDNWDTSNVESMIGLFQYCRLLNNLEGVSEWNVSNVTDMKYMFKYCSSLELLDLSRWSTSKVGDMSRMFWGCSSLTSLDLSNWDVSNVEYMFGMFYDCSSLESLNLSNWILKKKIADANYLGDSHMFTNCNNVTINTDGWEFLNDYPRDITYVFSSAPSSANLIGLDSWNVSNITNMYTMFEDCVCLKSADLKEWNASNVTTMESMFKGCTSLQTLDISGLNSSQNTHTCYMFSGCNNLISLNARDWDTSNVIDMSNMFEDCSNLSNIEGIDSWDVSNVGNNEYGDVLTDMFGMFADCSSLETLDINSWDMSNVKSTAGMFYNCTSLKSLPLIGRWNTSSITSMNQMFDGCSSLVFEFTDFISHWDTSNVDDMGSMFRNCSSLETLDINSWDMSNVRYIEEMFKGCSSLTNIYWNANFTTTFYMNSVFEGCSSLTSINVNNINTINVKEMSKVFKDCSSLETLNISSWDMSNVTTMESMFEGCTSLTYVSADGINIPYQNPGINIKIRNLNCMFKNCTSLTSIDISKLHTNLATITAHSMFEGCTSLESLKINVDALFDEEDCTDIFKDCDSLDSVTVIQDGNYIVSYSIVNLTHLLPDRTSMTSGTVEIPSIYDSEAFESAMNAIREKNWEIIFS